MRGQLPAGAAWAGCCQAAWALDMKTWVGKSAGYRSASAWYEPAGLLTAPFGRTGSSWVSRLPVCHGAGCSRAARSRAGCARPASS